MRKKPKIFVIAAVGVAVIVTGIWNDIRKDGTGRNDVEKNSAGRIDTEWSDTVWNVTGWNRKGQRRWIENMSLNEMKIQRDEWMSYQKVKKESESVQNQVFGKGTENESIEIELTEPEKNVLKKVSVDESAIEKGWLLAWQKALIQDMREAIAMLEEAYPSHTFQIVDAEDNRMDTSTESTFWFVADGDETRYVLYLAEKDGNKTMRDTFFGTLLSDPYERALLSWLQKKIPECVGCHASFDCATGEAYTEDSVRAVVRALLTGEDALANFTELYVDGTDCENPETLARKLEQEIRRQGIYGSYEIAVLLQLPNEITAHAETGKQAADRDTETGSISEIRREKKKEKFESEEPKSLQNDFKSMMKYIDKNRNNDRCVRVYNFSCFE